MTSTDRPVLATTGARIRYARKRKGLTQRDLSDKLGISKRQFARYEADQMEPPDDRKQEIARALGVATEWLDGRGARARFRIGGVGSVTLSVAQPIDSDVMSRWLEYSRSEEETVMLNVRVPRSLHAWIRDQSAARGIPIQRIAMLGYAFVRQRYAGQVPEEQ